MKDFLDYELGVEEVVVLGKGPSFDRYEGGGDLVVGINQVCRRVEVDVCISSHIEPLEEVDLGKVGCVLVPYFPLYGWNGKHDKRWDEHEVLRGRGNVYCYNPYWCSDRIGGDVSPVVQSFGTTGHHIVQLLASRGVKGFTFYGIDGGKKAYGKRYYSDVFSHDSKEYFLQGKIPANFDEFWTFYFQLRRKHGLTMRFM